MKQTPTPVSPWRTVVPSVLVGFLGGVGVFVWQVVGPLNEARANIEALRQRADFQRADFQTEQKRSDDAKKSTDERFLKMSDNINAVIALLREQNALLRQIADNKNKP